MKKDNFNYWYNLFNNSFKKLFKGCKVTLALVMMIVSVPCYILLFPIVCGLGKDEKDKESTRIFYKNLFNPKFWVEMWS